MRQHLFAAFVLEEEAVRRDRKSTRLNSRHGYISYAVFCWKKKTKWVTASTTSSSRASSAPSSSEPLTGSTFGNAGCGRLWTFFLNVTSATEIYTLSLHDALPI